MLGGIGDAQVTDLTQIVALNRSGKRVCIQSGFHWYCMRGSCSLAAIGNVCQPLTWWNLHNMPDEFLTLPEVALLLKVAEKTVYTMAQKGELPAFKVRGQWRFKRTDLDSWIEAQKAAARSAENS